MKSIIALILILSLSSCTCKVLNFDDEETFWSDVYEKGDILVLQSLDNAGSRDTIFISDKVVSTPTGDCNAMVSSYDTEGCVVDYTYKHNGKESDWDYLVQHFKENEGASLPVLRVYGTEFSGKRLKDTVIVTQKFGKLDDCFTFNSKDNYNGWSEFKIKYFVWSKTHGLVLIEGMNGERFELIEKIRK